METILRQLQLCELEILNEFVRVCDKHHIQYYLVGGTLLGSMRHQGFIPWDDDIDVGMLRADYDRFAKVCQTELRPGFFYQSPETDPNYFLSYAKLRKDGTEIYEARFEQAAFHKGVFIDIFPLDFCPPRGPVCHLLFNILAVMNYRGQVDSGEPYSPYSEISGKIGYTVLRLFSPKNLVKARRCVLWLSRQLSGQKCVASYSGAYGYCKEVSPYEWFRDTEPRIFEGTEYTTPTGAPHIMEQSYGPEYMQLPPESERKIHLQVWRTKL